MPGTPQTRINAFLTNETAGAIRPQVETLPNGNFLVMYATPIGGGNFAIHGQQFDSDGTPVGIELDFDFEFKVDEPEFDVFVKPNGQVVVAVEVETSTNDKVQIAARVYEIDESSAREAVRGINDFGGNNIVGFINTESFNPTLAGLANGDFNIFFANSNGFGRDYLDVAGRQGDEGIITRDQMPFAGRSDADISTAVLNNGTTVVVLDRDSDKGLRSKFDLRFFDKNLKQEKLIQIGGGARTFETTIEALEGGGFVVGWSQLERVLLRKSKQDTEVFVQVFDEDGTATSPKIRVGASANNDLNLNTSIVALEDGGFIVLFDKSRNDPGLHGQRYDADGKALGGEFRVFGGSVGEIDTTLLPDNRVVVSFEADGGIQTEILEFDDIIRGDEGANVLTGTGGDDVIQGLGGDDTISGGNGNDQIEGGAGNDIIDGDRGNDQIEGGAGNDTISGGRRDDQLEGGAGDDSLNGGNGADQIDGGRGNDVLSGGSGSDIFVFRNGDGQDQITDFDALDDAEVIDLTAVSVVTGIRQINDNVVIEGGAGLEITLIGVDLADLDNNDFVF